jgi:magnesium chelatase family protein
MLMTWHCAAGGHNLLFVGLPGTGKTLLASRLPGILPPMSENEALEAAAIASVAGMGLDPAAWRQRRFRCPHHTASGVALVGGGCQLQLLMRLYTNLRD